jgi:hypothetical protein
LVNDFRILLVGEDSLSKEKIKMEDFIDEKGNYLDKGLKLIYQSPEKISDKVNQEVEELLVEISENQKRDTLYQIVEETRKNKETLKSLGEKCFLFLLSEIYHKGNIDLYSADIVLEMRSFIVMPEKDREPFPLFIERLAALCIEYTNQPSV